MKYSYKKSNKKKIIYIFFIAIIIVAILLFLQNLLFQDFLSTSGYVQMQLDKISYSDEIAIVHLKGECSLLDIYITAWQASAIQSGVQGIGYRPGTHDIITQVLEEHNIRPILVKITKLQNTTYFAELYLRTWNHLSVLDIRPSDAMAIASRTNTPIYVNENLVIKNC